MGTFINLSGKKYGKLTVISPNGRNTNGDVMWKCKCDCGNISIVRGRNLRSGFTTSCGCNQKEAVRRANVIHGHCNTRIHRIWSAMKQRCYNPNNTAFQNYGGRGIKVCDDWLHDFLEFESWAEKHGYDDTLTIDRMNNDGNYEPSNCRWITRAEQNKNKRPWNCNQ